MGIEFGRNSRKTVTRGDMICSLQYVNEEEACVFWATHRIRSTKAREDKAGAYVIPLSSTWKYANDAYCVQQAQIGADVLGFGSHDKSAVKKLASFFQDMIIELLKMKPMPFSMQRSADITDVTVKGNKILIEANA